MRNYITLDGLRYHTSLNWAPFEERPMVARRLLSGRTNVTFGPVTYSSWRGHISADVTPKPLFGDVDTLRTTYKKLSSVEFVDHFGNAHEVVVDRGVDEKSASPMWTASDNTVEVNVVLIKI